VRSRQGQDGGVGWLSRLDEEVVLLEALPVAVADDGHAALPRRRSRPSVREAFRLLTPPASAWATPPGRAVWGGSEAAPWPGAGWRERRAWPDCSVRRVLDLPFAEARASLLRLGLATVQAARASTPECRVLLAVPVRHHVRAVAADVVVVPWSRARTEVRVELRPRRGRRLAVPRHWFDAAYPLLDDVAAALAA
jgi:hypothetical protein